MVVQDGDHVEPAREPEALEVADVVAPVLVAPPGREGHLPLLLGRPLGLLQSVEGAVHRHDAPAGPGVGVYAYLRERGVHPELAEVRVLLQAPYGGHCLEVHLAHPGRPAVGLSTRPASPSSTHLFSVR